MSILDKTKTKIERVKDELPKELVISFIKDNYHIDGSLEIHGNYNGYGKFVVDCDGDVVLKNKELTSLTDELFVWGCVDGDFDCSCSNIECLYGAPGYVLNGSSKWVEISGSNETESIKYSCEEILNVIDADENNIVDANKLNSF